MARHRDGFQDDFRALSRRTCGDVFVTGRQRYRNGNIAVTSGNTWYFQGGQLAKTAGGTMYYPNGNIAVTSSGTVYYPNGNIAYRGHGRDAALRDTATLHRHEGRSPPADGHHNRRRVRRG